MSCVICYPMCSFLFPSHWSLMGLLEGSQLNRQRTSHLFSTWSATWRRVLAQVETLVYPLELVRELQASSGGHEPSQWTLALLQLSRSIQAWYHQLFRLCRITLQSFRNSLPSDQCTSHCRSCLLLGLWWSGCRICESTQLPFSIQSSLQGYQQLYCFLATPKRHRGQ